MTELSRCDRERVQASLKELAEDVRGKTKWSISQVREYLRNLLDVSV